MNSTSILRATALTAAAFLSSFAWATPSAAPADRATQLLAQRGTIPVESAGPYVAAGTYRVQVAAKLGRPDLQLADGTWIYHQRRVSDSDAVGSLLVRFDARGRVASLELATATVVAALRAGPPSHAGDSRVAAK